MARIVAVLLALLYIGHATAFKLQTYDPAPAPGYTRSGYWSMTVNGQNVPVHAFDGYAYAHFAFGEGAATITMTSIQQTAITSFRSSPWTNYYQDSGTIAGNTITIKMDTPRYIIIKSAGVQEFVILADPLETNAPAPSGTGIFNVVTGCGADASGNSVTTAAFKTCIQAAGARGQGSIIYVPPGAYQVGNIILPSSTSLYLAAGSALRFTGNRADYTLDWHKNSQNLDGTEWIRTAFDSHDIKIYGRGTIDGNGKYAQQTGKFIAHSVVPINTTRFTFDGPVLRDGGSWTLMPTRSSQVMIDHAKVMNRMNLGENDGVDVQESQHVIVQNSIAIALDDSFSTKTWKVAEEITLNYPGPAQPQYNVSFVNNLAWTHCYGFKVGQGVWQEQTMIRFDRGTVYDAAVGLGVHHKWGKAKAADIQFTKMAIENLHGNNDGHQTWLAVFVQAGTAGFIGPIDNVSLQNIDVRARGASAAMTRGVDGALVSGVTLRNIWFKDTEKYATTLEAMNVTDRAFSSNVAVLV